MTEELDQKTTAEIENLAQIMEFVKKKFDYKSEAIFGFAMSIISNLIMLTPEKDRQQFAEFCSTSMRTSNNATVALAKAMENKK